MTSGGVILTGSRSKTRDSYAIVEALGPDFDTKGVSVGDKVLFLTGDFKSVPSEDKEDDKEYAIIKEASLLGVYVE